MQIVDDATLKAIAMELVEQLYRGSWEQAVKQKGGNELSGDVMIVRSQILRQVRRELNAKAKKIKKARKFLDAYAIKQGWVGE